MNVVRECTGRLAAAAQAIAQVYTADERPWVVAFSGGKDSTAALQMVYIALAKLPRSHRRKPVYVVGVDTRVDTPAMAQRLRRELDLVEAAAGRDGLPMSAHVVYPSLDDTFWVNLIGRGYASPTPLFRWCTDRLKIRPVSNFIRRVVHDAGCATVVLGVRYGESGTRDRSLRRHTYAGTPLRPHADLPRALVYTPIQELTQDDVWTYLLSVPSPWGGRNKELLALYRNATGGECPLVADDLAPACVNARFGCWTCTVVEKDRSVQALADAGDERLIPLVRVRDYLRAVRGADGARYDTRRNGATPYRRGTKEVMVNTGPFTHQTRLEILGRVLDAQAESGLTLIGGDELALIQEIWNGEECAQASKPDIPADAVARAYLRCREETDHTDLTEEEDILRQVCNAHEVPFELLRKLRDVEDEFSHLRRRHGLPDKMREIVREYADARIEVEP